MTDSNNDSDTKNSTHDTDRKATVADSIEDAISETDVSAEAEQAFHAMQTLEDVRDMLLDVDIEQLPLTVREDFASGTQDILQAHGEAEALYNATQSDE